MTAQDLLKPRYRVIADYPNSPFNIGEIIRQDSAGLPNNYISDAGYYRDRHPESYPAIFKKLEWWEERSESELPKYVKVKNAVREVDEWMMQINFVILKQDSGHAMEWPLKDGCFPATEEEYKKQNPHSLSR